MSKSNATKPPYTKRTGIPKIVKDKASGNVMLLCPFCTPAHSLTPNAPAACGTVLILTAEQTVIRAKYEKKLVCVKCGKGGGEMVMRQNAFVHLNDCMPGVAFLTEPPKFTFAAAFVNGLKPAFFKKTVEFFTGRAVAVDEVAPNGTRTGMVLGYFFQRK